MVQSQTFEFFYLDRIIVDDTGPILISCPFARLYIFFFLGTTDGRTTMWHIKLPFKGRKLVTVYVFIYLSIHSFSVSSL
jgi:hypothetical protein